MADLPLYTSDASRAIDAKAMQPVAAGGLGISGQVLMQRAAQYALDTLLSRCPNVRHISVVCSTAFLQKRLVGINILLDSKSVF